PGGGYSFVTTIDNSYKMFVYDYDYSVSPYTVSTRIYHLPGIISDISSPAAPLNEMSGMAFPNPSSSSVTIPYEISDFDGSAKLIVSDVSGKERRNILLNSAAGQVVVSGGDLHPGIYFYRINSKGELGQARKFIIQ
ncbi:MAG: T9SS type A sorting domain-containing protein, partial [Bacteroidetes bacterium]|nr:T9SS type A sorting domain-containing protein [Bacteroidota bacterium]